MKRISLLILMAGILFPIVAQDMPVWVEMGMGISQIREVLRAENVWLENPNPEEIAPGDYLYQFIKPSGNNQGLYQFFVTKNDGLVSLLITPTGTNYERMIDYLVKIYGEADYTEYINRGDELPVQCGWYDMDDMRIKLPRNLFSINIIQTSDGLFYIQYNFLNYSEE
jgi:hypothetical protein